MNSSRRALGLGWLLVCLTTVGCERSEKPAAGPSAGTPASGRPTVCVVNYPLEFFAERIGGDALEVVFPAPAGEDPAYWKPKADTIAAYQKADLILLNGASYARWVEQATLPTSRLVDTSSAFKDRYIGLEGAVKHAHGPEGDHAHAGIAFTTWLDPTLAVQQAAAVRTALAVLLPKKTDALDRNFESLKGDLELLDAQFDKLTKGHGETPLLGSHPVYQYFARRYGPNIRNVHWEPHEVPTDQQWAELDRLLEKHPAKWMIWEAPPASPTAEKLRGRGVSCAVFYPCGNAPPVGDYLQTMQRNLEALKPVFGSK